MGNSLFLWRLIFTIVSGVVFLTIMGVAAFFLITTFDESNPNPAWIGGFAAAVGLILLTVVVTCCVAGCLMAIPYLGTVLLLPVTVFFRGVGPEFLRQFGGEFDLREGSEDPFGFEPADPGDQALPE